MPPIDIADGIVVALIAFASGLVGYLANRQTSKEQATIQVMQTQISQLWERVQAQERRIDELEAKYSRERARSWAAIEYARALRAYVDALHALLPEGVDVPPPPHVPEAIAQDV